MTSRAPYQPLPVERSPAAVDLLDPDPRRARHAISSFLESSPLDDLAGQDLVGAVSEVVTNAQLHGRPPVRVRAWLADDEVVVTVVDHGEGPDDDDELGVQPVARGPGEGGLGLWLAGQLCHDLSLGHTPYGFAVRLRARPGPGGAERAEVR